MLKLVSWTVPLVALLEGCGSPHAATHGQVAPPGFCLPSAPTPVATPEATHGEAALPSFGTPEDWGDGQPIVDPALVRVTRPVVPARCKASGWLYFGTSGQTIMPYRPPQRRPEKAVAVLREGAPRELDVRSGEERRVVEVLGGSLVAIDKGEFGAGLYWLAASSERAEPIDARLTAPIRWLGQTRDHIFAVSGLCHGQACDPTSRSVVFEVTRNEFAESPKAPFAWRVEPIAILRGCPSAIGTVDVAASEQALLVATCHGLHRIAPFATARVAAWPTFLSPVDIAVTAGPEDLTYHVSFGSLMASFTQGHESWFTPTECATGRTDEPTDAGPGNQSESQ